jgi:hypothetical protein
VLGQSVTQLWLEPRNRQVLSLLFECFAASLTIAEAFTLSLSLPLWQLKVACHIDASQLLLNVWHSSTAAVYMLASGMCTVAVIVGVVHKCGASCVHALHGTYTHAVQRSTIQIADAA